MTTPIRSFMHAVLGEDAATALAKAADRSEALGSVLGPRTIVGWLALASRWDFEGEIPGMPGSNLEFHKNEATDLFHGSVTIANETYDFEHANLTHLAAALSCALGVNGQVSKALKDSELVKLGANIDLLVKMQVVNALRKSNAPDALRADCKECGGNGKKDGKPCPGCVAKAELPGQAAAPKGPGGPEAPEAPTPTAPSRSKPPPKAPGLKVTKSQAESHCSVCDAPQFKGDTFTGCFCLRSLGKFAKAEPVEGGYMVAFGSEWTKNNIKLLFDIMGPGEGR
jgi:hypothetical protein